MEFISTIILGIIQGIAEFLPISSSAHLIIFRDLFGIGTGLSDNLNLTFDLALHFGTLLSIAVFFFTDFINMIKKGFTKGIKDDQGKILWYLVIATVPAGIAGVVSGYGNRPYGCGYGQCCEYPRENAGSLPGRPCSGADRHPDGGKRTEFPGCDTGGRAGCGSGTVFRVLPGSGKYL